jgi:hypothetical protein
VDILPTDAEATIDNAGMSAGDAMLNEADATELFNVKMDQLTQVFAFIAPDRFGRLQGAELVEAEPPRTRLTVAGETPTFTAICLPVQRCRRSRSISLTTAAGGWRSRCGLDERSCNPINPSRR